MLNQLLTFILNNMKTQEVRVMLQLTLDVDTELSKEDIEVRLRQAIEGMELSNLVDDMTLEMTDIIEIREEAEIYGTEE